MIQGDSWTPWWAWVWGVVMLGFYGEGGGFAGVDGG